MHITVVTTPRAVRSDGSFVLNNQAAVVQVISGDTSREPIDSAYCERAGCIYLALPGGHQCQGCSNWSNDVSIEGNK